MIRWTNTCKFTDLHAALVLALLRVEAIYAAEGLPEVWITSANDRKHKAGSKHYMGKAVDIRSKVLKAARKQPVAQAIQSALGPTFYVELEDEGKANEHIHLQFNEAI